jgi:hypothetical protein
MFCGMLTSCLSKGSHEFDLISSHSLVASAHEKVARQELLSSSDLYEEESSFWKALLDCPTHIQAVYIADLPIMMRYEIAGPSLKSRHFIQMLTEVLQETLDALENDASVASAYNLRSLLFLARRIDPVTITNGLHVTRQIDRLFCTAAQRNNRNELFNSILIPLMQYYADMDGRIPRECFLALTEAFHAERVDWRVNYLFQIIANQVGVEIPEAPRITPWSL